MNLFRKQPEAEPPEGVVIVRPGLPDVKCGVLRDPDQDADGNRAWQIVPVEPVVFRRGIDQVRIGVLPGRTSVFLDLTCEH